MFNQQKIKHAGGDIAIDLSDKSGFVEAVNGISGDDIDVVLHSPGGSPEATESIVQILRSRFKNIRFIIPSVAKSAATMLAMSGNEIILGKDAEMGPTDPQMNRAGHLNPAHAILRQFDEAKREIGGNSDNLPAWLPILEQYGPSLLVQCKDAQNLTKTLVKDWVFKYMFNADARKKRKAATIAAFLCNKNHLSHGRAIPIEELKKRGVLIKRADEYTPDLSEAIKDIDYATLQTFALTGAYKMFENHLGKGLYKVLQQASIQLPIQIPQPVKK